MSEDDIDWSNYESGPFCRHWYDPADCDETCYSCVHSCRRHAYDAGASACDEDECDCLAWMEPPND